MIRCKIALVYILSSVALFGQPIWNDVVALSAVGSASAQAVVVGDCVIGLTNLTLDSIITASAPLAQKLPFGNTTLCSLDAHIASFGGANFYFGIFSATNGGGTQIGKYSDTNYVETGVGGSVWTNFTFTVQKPVTTGDAYLTLFCTASGVWSVKTDAYSPGYALTVGGELEASRSGIFRLYKQP